jgi:Tol biopolymer transport system component
VAASPDFSPVDFTPDDFACNPLIVGSPPSLSWSPDGQHLLFSGHYQEQAIAYDVAYAWHVARQSRQGQSLPDIVGRWLRFAGWMDGRTVVYSTYVGGGHREIAIVNIHTGQKIAETTVHVDVSLSFSPDGRYFTFFTPGPLQLDQNGWPVGLLSQAEGANTMHILDTESGQVIISIEDSEILPVWSPDSSHFLVQDRADNLMLAEISHRHITPLIRQSGAVIRRPQWSYDGRYLSVSAAEPDNNQVVANFILLLQSR